jgi:hypothetical protein
LHTRTRIPAAARMYSHPRLRAERRLDAELPVRCFKVPCSIAFLSVSHIVCCERVVRSSLPDLKSLPRLPKLRWPTPLSQPKMADAPFRYSFLDLTWPALCPRTELAHAPFPKLRWQRHVSHTKLANNPFPKLKWQTQVPNTLPPTKMASTRFPKLTHFSKLKMANTSPN